jgi:hypothetical protein
MFVLDPQGFLCGWVVEPEIYQAHVITSFSCSFYGWKSVYEHGLYHNPLLRLACGILGLVQILSKQAVVH